MTHSRGQDVVTMARRLFDGEVIEIRPRGPLARGAWPNQLALGPRHGRAFTFCADCGAGTWAQYGDVPLCRPCTMLRWAREQRDRFGAP
jgi:hypothetical protein